MPTALQTRARNALNVVITFAPWVIAMYLFWWLDSSGVWTSDTPHRGKLSVAILSAGMLLSFSLWSYFAKREQ